MKRIMSIFLGIIIGGIGIGAVINNFYSKALHEQEQKVKKFKQYYSILNQWLFLKQEDRGIEIFFEKNHYKHIAIYGMGELGQRLLNCLNNSGIKVDYAIDADANYLDSNLKIYEPDDNFPQVDAIIVTAVFDFEKIYKVLSQNCKYKIISLEDVIFDIK